MHKISLLIALASLQNAIGNEGVILKRITEFWKDQAYDQAKTQILSFLSEHPSSDYRDNLYAMLGDLYMREQAYQEAMTAYDKIVNKELQNKTEGNYLQALFELGDYRAILKKASRQSQDPRVDYLAAEACFRLGKDAIDTETQKTLFIQAASHYNRLVNTAYAADALFPLAEIYRILGENSKAVSFYLYLADVKPELQEEFLFQAAYLQASFDKKEAVKTFGKVVSLNGKKAGSAAQNMLSLLFEEKNYGDFIAAYKRIQHAIPQEAEAEIAFYLGRSYFELEKFSEAIAALEKGEGKNAFLLLAACAEKAKDPALLDRALHRLSMAAPHAPETAQAYLLHAHLSMEQGDTLHAQRDIEFILENFPNHPEKETLLRDYGMLLSHNTLWEESRKIFLSFLQEYPQSPYVNEVWRHLLNCALKENDREIVADLLGRALKESNTFSTEERKEYQLLWIKLLMEQEKKESIGKAIFTYLEEFPNSAQGYCLAALYCSDDPESFVIHAEKALSLDPFLSESDSLRLQLYNIYIQHESSHDKAAEQLYHCHQKGIIPLKTENLRWLANFYAMRISEKTARDRAFPLYAKLFENEISPTVEQDLLKYCELLQKEGKASESVPLLEQLVEKQQTENTLPWQFQRRSLFELAKSYEATNQIEKALQAYDQLVATSTHLPSYFSKAAQLQRARLQLMHLSQEERREESPKIEAILHDLKDLQVRKKLHSEPLHLEAALEYAEVMATLSGEDARKERMLFLLKRVKEDFTSQEDLLAKDYQSQRSHLPEKAEIVDSYIRFLDAELLRLEGEEEKAKALYESLLNSSLTPELEKRIMRRMGYYAN
jgi:tetratricopeptide (TPR) repeat protein